LEENAMRLLTAVIAVLILKAAAVAQPRAHNTLTPKEIGDGWLLLFDGETGFGWQADGKLEAQQGALILGKDAQAWTTTDFGSYELDFEHSGRGQLLVASPDQARKKVNGPGSNLAAGAEWSRTRLKLQIIPGMGEGGTTSQRTIDGAVVQHEDWRFPQPMHIWFEAKDKLLLRNVKLRPLGLKSIFSGQDLAGWKEHPGKKSKFTVADGELNIKDGPGDLQTEGKWADFVLQLECKSHGKHLNSGVFFRCIPDVYQQGYEMQIRNQFTSEATQDYVVDVYDPATNKLVEKKKIKSPAVDYGTGAIYRRVPARKEAAKDGEWFTLTLVAEGRRIATWVNGIQTVNWTDNRPAADNGRNGFRAAAGPISLQGHDPTTDLSFRNFRIAELPGR
jgi:hypothetical protein